MSTSVEVDAEMRLHDVDKVIAESADNLSPRGKKVKLRAWIGVGRRRV